MIIQKILREANITTHTLTNVMRNLSYGTKMFKEIPTEIIEQFRMDRQFICNESGLSL